MCIILLDTFSCYLGCYSVLQLRFTTPKWFCVSCSQSNHQPFICQVNVVTSTLWRLEWVIVVCTITNLYLTNNGILLQWQAVTFKSTIQTCDIICCVSILNLVDVWFSFYCSAFQQATVTEMFLIKSCAPLTVCVETEHKCNRK